MSDSEENIEHSENIEDSENIEHSEIVQITMRGNAQPMFKAKMSCTSVRHHTFTFKNPRNINNDNFQAIVAQSTSTRTTLVLEPSPQYELSKGNGIFLIRKIPAGTVLNIEEMNAINNGSRKIGLTLKSIGINYGTDGAESSSSNSTIKELSHDVIVITIRGAKKFMGSQMLLPKVNYLEIDRTLEKKIYDRHVRKDIERLNEDNKEPSIINKIFKMFSS